MWKLGFVILAAAAMSLAQGWTSALGQEGEADFLYQAGTGICKGIENGDRIRISVNSGYAQEMSDNLEEGGTITGKLVSCDDGVLVIKTDYRLSSADPIRIPADDVDRLEVSQGRSSHAAAGAGIGLFAGCLVGLSLQREEVTQSGWNLDFTDELQNGARLAGAVVGGVIVGAIIGSLIGSEKWEKVYEDYSISFLGNNSSGEYQVVLGYSF